MLEKIKEFGSHRKWVHVASVAGRFQHYHRAVAVVLFAFLLIVPWIRINGLPLFLQDMVNRRAFVFGWIFTPRDTLLFLGALLSGGFALFLFTSLFGRLWCGYTCPQSVILEEVIRPIEKFIEGERTARIRLDESPWNAEKIRKKFAKWLAFAIVSAVVAFGATGWFVDIYTLVGGTAPKGAYVMMGAAALVLFFDFAWFREQFCNYLCPYARLQGVLTDQHTMMIGYEFKRGEPRRVKGAKPEAPLGACIGCDRCVHVCPAGIDIRDGFQLECIGCARCIDACTDVMAKRNEPTLVKYASYAELHDQPKKKVRFRPVIYTTALAFVLTGTAIFVAGRDPVDITLTQPMVSRVVKDGVDMLQNMYQVTIFNSSSETVSFNLQVRGLDEATVVIASQNWTLPPGQRSVVPVFVSVPSTEVHGAVKAFDIVVVGQDIEVSHRAIFRNLLENTK